MADVTPGDRIRIIRYNCGNEQTDYRGVVALVTRIEDYGALWADPEPPLKGDRELYVDTEMFGDRYELVSKGPDLASGWRDLLAEVGERSSRGTS